MPPTQKAWATVGSPNLLIIGSYEMGVEIRPEKQGSRLRVFIAFDLPTGITGYWLGRLFSGAYAKWCVRQMLEGVVMHLIGPFPGGLGKFTSR